MGRHYLACALEGLASEAWVGLVARGCLGGDASALREGLRQVLGFGHTSGADTLAGFLFGLQSYCSGTEQ